jgi:histone deacetylase 6
VQALLGEGLAKRVLIVDWDVHHGDGTQAAVIGDSTLRDGCCFVSIHRHDAEFWPKSGKVGEGGGGARVVNVPLYGVGFGDSDYYRVFEAVIAPVAKRFKPDLVIVSAGYDCADGDKLGRFSVTAGGFNALTRLALSLTNSAGLLVLEGGYDVDDTSGHGPLVSGVCASIDGLEAGPMELGGLPAGWRAGVRPETEAVVAEVLGALPDQL